MKNDLATVYNIPKLKAKQIEQVRIGLQSGIDPSIYAKPEFKAKQMKQIRLGLQSGVNVKVYAKPKFSAKQMREIRIGLEEGIDLTSYAKCGLEAENLEEIRLKIIKERNKETEKDKCEEVDEPEYELTLDNYVIPSISTVRSDDLSLVPILQNMLNWKMQYSYKQLGQIMFGLQLDVDVTRYLDPAFDVKQMIEIRWGLEEGKNVAIYAKPDISWRIMDQIRLSISPIE